MQKKFIEPRLLKGFQDHLPPKSFIRNKVKQVISNVYEKYGFSFIETPAIELKEILLGPGGENINKEIFFLETPEGEKSALRFDHTVPFARIIAQYPDIIKLPFRRYTIGSVWRADKPGIGRYREFVQMDVDIAGTPNISADAEIVAVMVEIMKTLGFKNFRVHINNRKLIDALLIFNNIINEETQKHVLRVIDKLQKVGIDNVRKELGQGRIDESGDPIKGVGLSEPVINKILNFINIKAETRKEILVQLKQQLPESSEAQHAIETMEELDEYLTALDISDREAIFSPSLTRGLDYYSGPVFEMILTDAPHIGSVMGGGRYDTLVSRFTDKLIPCTGMSIGLDRLISAMEELNLFERNLTPYDVIITRVGKVPIREALAIAKELRNAGFRVSVYLGKKTKETLGEQLSHANHYNIPTAIILGEDELKRGEVCIKDLYYGEKARENIKDREQYREAGTISQVTIPREKMIDTLHSFLLRNK
ncbi:MAG TPA: histidine--tRNA ligase [Candidatus Hydrogenedens sp.]|nr:histidine--tRNA ligase [Candidatus Hydrogenedens sp.]HOK09926.1 histidine--tRNA ligase [Candidatus Hydrogenedens sp.]HOL19647.1 histidine--tRNA ligase [Candidatus Hydrogenedens sp.]HPP57714.1 histidine--tRNA ligase [Candidatus Hydrogenedens sp.]